MYETLPPTLHYEYTLTTISSPLPQFPLTSASPNTRFSDQELHRTSRFPQHQHPPPTSSTSNTSTNGSITYSTIPSSTLMILVYRKQFKTIPGSLQHPTNLSLLPSAPTAGCAPYLMASALLPTMDQFLAVCHPLSKQKHTASSLTFASYTALASTLTPLYPQRLSSILTLPV